MSLRYKKCEICETDINKLQSWWNIYTLKAGAKLKCPKCGTEYKTNKALGFIGSLYVELWVWVIPILLLVEFIDSFRLNLGIEVWLYAFILYSTMELIIAVILPLNKIENKN
ncbi:MAG: hypothetical protein WA080_09685 [Sulfuricurvum sp.]